MIIALNASSCTFNYSLESLLDLSGHRISLTNPTCVSVIRMPPIVIQLRVYQHSPVKDPAAKYILLSQFQPEPTSNISSLRSKTTTGTKTPPTTTSSQQCGPNNGNRICAAKNCCQLPSQALWGLDWELID